MNRLRVGVVGAGHLGKFHARLLANHPDVTLIGVADPVATAREALATECRTEAIADYRDLIGRIDAAVVAAPTKLHREIGLQLLAAGIHCLMEKPITTSTSEANELIATAHAHGAILQVGHIERFNPALVAVRPQLSSPKYLECVRHTPYTFRSTDVGVVLDLMIHDIDIVLSLVQSPVRHVDAVGVSVIGPHEDVAQARLSFENGAVANLSASRVSYQPQRSLQAWTAEQFTAVNFADRSTTVVRRCAALTMGDFSGDKLTPAEKDHYKTHLFDELLPKSTAVVEARNAMADEQADFLDAVRTGQSPQVTGEAGREALSVAEQILQAISDHAWDGHSAGRFGSHLERRPAILRGPHFPLSPAVHVPHREAG